MSYHIIAAEGRYECETLGRLEGWVVAFKEQGWTPLGGVSVSREWFKFWAFQAMVRP